MSYFCDNCRSDIETYDLFMMPMTATINGVEYNENKKIDLFEFNGWIQFDIIHN